MSEANLAVGWDPGGFAGRAGRARALPGQHRKRLCLALALLMLGACGTDLTPPWRVIEPRLFAARVEVEGDAARSRPKPGESFTLRQYLVLPKPLSTPPSERYSMQLALCFGFRAPDGRLICADELELPVQITAVSDTELHTSPIFVPDFEGLIPADASTEFGEIDQVSVFGAVCVEGRVARVEGKQVDEDPPSQLFRCADNEGAEFPDPLVFTMSVLLDLGRLGDLNHNPHFECTPDTETGACHQGVESPEGPAVPGPIVLVGPERDEGERTITPWPSSGLSEAELPWEGCIGSGLPEVHAGSGEHLVRVRFDPEDRERFEYETEEFGKIVVKREREELLLAEAVTEFGGTLSGHFSVVEADTPDAEAEIELTYEPPKQSDEANRRIPEDGRLVRLFFALRDGRGGVDFTTRALCLLPPDPTR